MRKTNVLSMILTLMIGALTLTVMAWERDQLLERMVPETCEIEEFESLEHYEKERGRHETWTVPFLIRGVAQSWDARHHWQKEYLIEKYGSRIVKHGSEYSIRPTTNTTIKLQCRQLLSHVFFQLMEFCVIFIHDSSSFEIGRAHV